MYPSIGHENMDEIINDPYMLGLVIFYAEQSLVPPELVCAIIEAESMGASHACSYESLGSTAMQSPRPARCNIDTESVCQKMRWGLMQLSGATVRRLGYDLWLSELSVPVMNLEWGVKYLVHLTNQFYKRHGYAGVIAAYHSGNPRKVGTQFVNQLYVDKVLKLMARYQPIIAEKREQALAVLETQVLTPEEVEAAIRCDKGIGEYLSHTLEELKAMAAERGIEAAKGWKKANYAEALYSLDLDAIENAAKSGLQG
ncbi:lytic transglycosylase domain-containing protein [Cloacibacillus evryensis]|uniref:lytic transglycosylase domain-containing protein n=1 Tax=Cloacibacillus evryensis TaxID=508460 RepID=UPI002673DBA0|nr:lytic transglycosylase domain-containing protein [Cloacibacillus evryensis]